VVENDMPTDRIVAFLKKIGIDVSEGEVAETSFLPGVRIERGGLIVDRQRLAWPGDLLHEAGHIATTPASERHVLSDALDEHADTADVGEPEATAWAYAACRAIGLAPSVLFHDEGYHGQSAALIATFGVGVYPGSAGLARCGMTRVGSAAGIDTAGHYPQMLRWLRG
jgi:hypothetical protein